MPDSRSTAGSVTWKIAREAIINLGGARAVLMQLAHPLVATGVAQHSTYLSDPIGRSDRTFVLGQLLTFGNTEKAFKAARTINRLHTHVHGSLPASAGDFASGTSYRARDPELLLWVHATLIDTILLIYPLLVGPLSEEEQDQYYQESKELARLLGLSARDMPATADDLRQYVHDMVYSNKLAATPQARQIARVVLFPPVPRIFHPLFLYNLHFTIATLPPPIREIYGLEWSKHQQVAFDLSTLAIRTAVSHLPPKLRVLPITQRLMQETENQLSSA
ncbi:MAG TPA: oxygenase MpaB family protein [Ktedonobacteraceae bacterium]|nr:oxygenase MpaB family protein [Ktedonobacteraceae bacterium]